MWSRWIEKVTNELQALQVWCNCKFKGKHNVKFSKGFGYRCSCCKRTKASIRAVE